jgi:hypothetical protein
MIFTLKPGEDASPANMFVATEDIEDVQNERGVLGEIGGVVGIFDIVCVNSTS